MRRQSDEARPSVADLPGTSGGNGGNTSSNQGMLTLNSLNDCYIYLYNGNLYVLKNMFLCLKNTLTFLGICNQYLVIVLD